MIDSCSFLLSGEFTQENQVRLKHEEEKEQTRVDEWKVNHADHFINDDDDDDDDDVTSASCVSAVLTQDVISAMPSLSDFCALLDLIALCRFDYIVLYVNLVVRN